MGRAACMPALLESGGVPDEGAQRRTQQGLPLALSRVQAVLHCSHWNGIRGNPASSSRVDLRDMESMLLKERDFGAATFTRDGDYAQVGSVYSPSHPSRSGRSISAETDGDYRSR